MDMTLHRFSFEAMACENEIRFYADDEQMAHASAGKAIAEVRRIERSYSRYREDSIISHINRMSGQSAITVDEETAFLLKHAASCHHLSHGLFDITSGVLRRVWNFRSGVPPSPQAIAATLPLIGWDKIEWDGSHIRLAHAGMEIDFGGIGKEYAVDRATAILQTCGITSGVVNLGGDVRVLGPHPDGSPWHIHISHPRQPGAILTTIDLAQGALTTSGDYQRFFDFDGKRYCHILNPHTGQPVAYWQSATIIAPLCLDAGSLSTMAMLLESTALSFLAERQASFLLIDQQGKVHHSRH